MKEGIKELLIGCKADSIFFERDPDTNRFKGRMMHEPFVCWINTELNEYEQVFTVAHEKLHCHPDYNKELDINKDLIEQLRKEEDSIEKNVSEAFIQEPRLIDYLIGQLRLAKVRVINESVNGRSKWIKQRARGMVEGYRNRCKYPWLSNYAHQRLYLYEESETLKDFRIKSLKETIKCI